MIKLRTKFFAAIFLVNVALVVGLYLFLRFSFENNFTQYVSQRERGMAEALALALENHYRSEGSWNRFREQPGFWINFYREHGRPRRRNFPSERGFPPSRKSVDFHDPDRSHSPAPLFLLDQERTLIAGMQWPRDQSYIRPLTLDNQTIGYLGVPIRREMRDYLDQQFAQGQSKNLVIILAATLVMALLIALPLSYLLSARISHLVKYVQQLSQGRYRQPLHLKGSDELNVLAEHLQDLGTTLAKVEQQRNQWVADISHELRTPVSILQADLESMEDGVRQLDQPALKRLQRHLLRLKNLIEDLHNLSLSDSGSLTYRKTACDIHDIVGDTVALLKPQFEKRGIALNHPTNTSESLTVLGDSQRLSQLVVNLLQNSLNYTDAPGKTQVTVQREGEWVSIAVSDSAPGVATELRPKLTERLFRVDSSRARNTGGAGLGLSLCANIVAAHGGSMTFTDSPFGGLTVIVKLPFYRAAV